MKPPSGVGIIGLGVALPPEIRSNEWWPRETTRTWQRLFRMLAQSCPVDDLDPASILVRRALDELREDPFQGGRERRVLAPAIESSELEADAARAAIADSGIALDEIGAIVSYSSCPDFCQTQSAAAIHRRLSLPEPCLSMQIEAGCNSFLMQLELVRHMIAAGELRYALLVQSSVGSRLTDPAHPFSSWFGDGATAVVVGRVPAGRGVVASAFRTNGARHRALVFGVPGKAWYEEGRIIFHSADPGVAHEMITTGPKRAAAVTREVLAKADCSAEAVDFYACHQGTAWMRRVTQELAGLDKARSLDTYSWASSLSAANIPLVLFCARREGLLRNGDLVAMFSAGTGETWGSILLRWGSGE